MSKPPFTHLHVHTQYSLLDGAARLKDMFDACNEMGMTHIAMSDHGNLHGAYDFFHSAKKAGVTPIIGIEAYVAPESRRNKRKIQWGQPHQKRDDVSGSGGYTHKTIWAANSDRSAQPLPALLGRVRRGLAAEVAAYGQGDHLPVVRGADRLHRLPLRRAADPAAPRPVRRGPEGGRRVPGHLRQGPVLPGADGPRHRHRAPGPRRPPGDRQEARHPAAGDERLALHVRARVGRARRPAVHPDRQEPLRPGPLPLRRHRLLPEVHGRDVRHRLLGRLAGGLPQHPPGRRADRHRRHVRGART